MTLLDSKPPKPVSGIRKYVPLPILVLLIIVVAGPLVYHFWNYPEERAVSRFLTTLKSGDYQKAYQLWQPSSSYNFQNFLSGWGEKGDYGKIREFKIIDSRSKGSSTVIVTVRINSVDPPLDLLVDRRTKGLSYSVFE